jgi:Rod binding domain-containing protein
MINQVHYSTPPQFAREVSKEQKVAQDFEAIFLRQILNENMIEDSEQMKTIKNMYNAEISKGMASSGGFGLAGMMVEQWRKNGD